MLTEVGDYSGPTEIVVKDKAMLMTILLWALTALVVAYEVALFGPAGLVDSDRPGHGARLRLKCARVRPLASSAAAWS